MEMEIRLMERRLNEVNQWLLVFPAEVWQMIIDFLKHPGDMYNCAVASPLLENLLEPHKMTFLFYQVLKVIDNPSILHQKPNLLTYLPPKDLRSCRLVSTGWDNAINLFLESRPSHSAVSRLPSTTSTDIPSHLPPNFLHDPAHRFYLRLYTIPFTKLRSLLQRLNSRRIQSSPLRCPTPTRHLEILECLQDRPESQISLHRRRVQLRRHHLIERIEFQPALNPLNNYRSLTKTFLEKLGPSFCHLTIQTKHLQQVQIYLELLPNLKSLIILSNQDKETMVPPTPNQIFPALQNLNRLHFGVIPDAIVKVILDANGDVQIVEILRKPFPKPRGKDLEEKADKQGLIVIPWPLNPVIFATSIRSSEELFGMPINWRRLSVLRLDFKACNESIPNWVMIFRKLEAYQDSLSELYLELPQNVTVEDKMKAWEASRKSLNLPLLKRFEFTVRSFSSLDFLLGLRALEHLRLRLEHTEKKSNFVSFVGYQVEKINFHDGFAERFLECNVWKLMENLKEVDLGFQWRPAKIYKRCHLNKM